MVRLSNYVKFYYSLFSIIGKLIYIFYFIFLKTQKFFIKCKIDAKSVLQKKNKRRNKLE